jgi:hypothetical protein
VPAGDADGTGHLVGGPGPADRDRAALAHARVACVQRELERLGARGVRTERRAQIGEERVVCDERSLGEPVRCTARRSRYAPPQSERP